MRINFSNSSVTLDAAAGDSEPRISGIAAPYGVDAEVSTGQRVRIMAGALPVDGKDLRAAIDAVLSGAKPSPDQRPSIGCNIKWRATM